VLFNHTRAYLLGENTVAQRLLLVLLFPLFLTGMALIFSRLGISRRLSLIAGLITLCAKYSAYHYGWLSDGIHIFQGLLFALSALTLLRYLARPMKSRKFLALSLLLFFIFLLTREDGLALVPALVAIAGLYLFREPSRSNRFLHFFSYIFLLALLTGVFWFWRSQALSGVTGLNLKDFSLWPGLVLDQFVLTVQLSGRSDFPEFFEVIYKTTLIFIALFPIFFLSGNKGNSARSLVALFLQRQVDSAGVRYWRFSILFMGLTFSACLNSVVLQRTNLTLFSTLFYAISLCTLATAYFLLWQNTSRFLLRPVATLVGLVLIAMLVINARSSILLQESMSFYSTQSIRWNTDLMFNPGWRLTMPEERRATVLEALEGLGIDRESYNAAPLSKDNIYNRLYCAAQTDGRRHPENSPTPFIPVRPMFYEDGWKQAAPPCFSLR
jgi:hypothetical protein